MEEIIIIWEDDNQTRSKYYQVNELKESVLMALSAFILENATKVILLDYDEIHRFDKQSADLLIEILKNLNNGKVCYRLHKND